MPGARMEGGEGEEERKGVGGEPGFLRISKLR